MTLSELLTCTRKVKEINFKLNSSTKITTAEESDDKRNQEKNKMTNCHKNMEPNMFHTMNNSNKS